MTTFNVTYTCTEQYSYSIEADTKSEANTIFNDELKTFDDIPENFMRFSGLNTDIDIQQE